MTIHPPIDWNAAREALVTASLAQLRRFMEATPLADFHAFGFTLQAFDGQIWLGANTETYHRQSWTDYRAKFDGTEDGEEAFRWNTANWLLPAGILPREPDLGPAWIPFAAAIERQAVREADEPDAYDGLKDEFMGTAIAALRQIIASGVFGTHIHHLNFTVLEVDDADDAILDRHQVFEECVREQRAMASG
jgi:hypothetical protein